MCKNKKKESNRFNYEVRVAAFLIFTLNFLFLVIVAFMVLFVLLLLGYLFFHFYPYIMHLMDLK